MLVTEVLSAAGGPEPSTYVWFGKVPMSHVSYELQVHQVSMRVVCREQEVGREGAH